MASRTARTYEASPDLAFEALRRAVTASGFEVQGSDPRARTIYFKSGRTNMSGSVQAAAGGASTVSLVGASGDLHDRVGREVETLVAESRATADVRSPPTSSTELAADLERLGNLHERGLLTDDEFADAKSRAFGREPEPTPVPEPSPVPSQPVSTSVSPPASPPPAYSTPPERDEGGLVALVKRYWRRRSKRGKILTVGLAVAGLVIMGAALAPGGNDTASTSITTTTTTTTERTTTEGTTTAEPTPTASTPKGRVREAVGSEVDASGWAGTLEVQDVSFDGREAQVTVATPEGGFEGASCDDLNEGAKAVWAKVYNDAAWNGGALVVFKGGLVSTVTGEELPDVNTGIYTIHADQAAQIDWSNEDALLNIDWSYYRDFCHPAMKQ